MCLPFSKVVNLSLVPRPGMHYVLGILEPNTHDEQFSVDTKYRVYGYSSVPLKKDSISRPTVDYIDVMYIGLSVSPSIETMLYQR